MTLKQHHQPTSTSTPNHLIDRLKAILASTTGANPVIHRPWKNEIRTQLYGDRKYYSQAFDLLSIGALDPVLRPKFIIYLSDIYEISRELFELDATGLRFVLRQAVGRIFEDIGFNLYHNSISSVLEVQFK